MQKTLLIVATFILSFSFIALTLAQEEYIQYDLDRLAKKAEVRIKQINKKVEEIETRQRAQKKLDELQSLYLEAETLFKQGQYKQARPLYERIKTYTRDPDIKSVARQKKEELKQLKKQRIKEERQRQKQLEAEQREQARL